MTAGSASKTIGSIFMNDAAQDEIGIRGTVGGNLAYTNGQTIRWFGSGILDKPISDFKPVGTGARYGFLNDLGAPYFAQRNNQGSFSISVNSHIIPEPEGYALVFGLFALAFVIVRRRFQKKELRNGR